MSRPEAAVRSRAVDPYRVELSLVTSGADAPDVEARFDQLVDEAEALGFFTQGGSFAPMPRADVIAGSPLATALDT